MKKTFLVLLIATIMLFIGCSPNNQQPPANDQQTSPHESETTEEEITEEIVSKDEPEVLAENLEIPWSIDNHNDVVYLTERPGNIVVVDNGTVERHTLELQEEISTAAEAGLLGFVLAPDFSVTNLAFAYYTYEDNFEQFNRIVTLRLEVGVWTEESVLVDHIEGGTYHHGGRLKIGPDGLLYATTGDASIPEISQELDFLGGKILRLHLDGTIPSDNPIPDSYVYSYGHRNPQGLTWSNEGMMYSSEHGGRANDEINLIEAGKNYGWPLIQGNEEGDGMVTPLFTSGSSTTWAPSGMAYFEGRLYVAGLRGAAIYEFDLETGEYQEFITGFGRIRDVFIEEDILYFITNNTDGRGNPAENDDKLYRISLSN